MTIGNRQVWLVVVGWVVVGIVAGCSGASNHQAPDRRADTGEERRQIEDEFGKLTDEQIEGFERELATQYRQLELTYQDYDALLDTDSGEVENNHEEHRTHRRLKRRHYTLARLHEERMWLRSDGGAAPSEDAHRAKLHRAAARWHESNFDDDGNGIVEQDGQLEAIRRNIDQTTPDGIDIDIEPVDH